MPAPHSAYIDSARQEMLDAHAVHKLLPMLVGESKLQPMHVFALFALVKRLVPATTID